jgi:hypothetical protein
MDVENRYVDRFRRQLARGEMVLFTGAGFSYDAIARDGRPVAQVDDLKVELARIAFPSSPDAAEQSSIADLYEVAVARGEGRVRQVFQDRLRVDPRQTPERFDRWFSMPWKRHYTVNVDDLDDIVNGRASLQRSIRSLSALAHASVQGSELLSVHLNGRLREFPHVTFAARQYARRAGLPDPWYEMLTSDLLTSPVLFVGTVVDEPGLWQHLEMRNARGQGEVELRPPSYLVSPSLPPARAALLKRFNVDWLPVTEKEFHDQVLAGASAEAESGHQAIQRQHHPTTAASSLRSVSQLRSEKVDVDLGLYLHGREPVWADVGPDGFAVVRSFEANLLDTAKKARSKVLLITGTAASGKSTTGMRLTLALATDGAKAFSYDTASGSLSPSQVVRAARTHKPEVIFIDDVDVFGDRAGRLLHDLTEIPSTRQVVATIRNSRLQNLDIEGELQSVEWSEHAVPPLQDSDIDAVIDSLQRAGLLGLMAGQNQEQRRRIFRDQAGRQLLVAMYFATSGEQLEDKVRSECEDLSGASRMAYGIAALATSDRQSVPQAELLLGLASLGFTGDGNQVLNEIEKLVQRQLLVRSAAGLSVRHRWIAEKSVDFFMSNGLMHKVVGAWAFALASQIDAQSNQHTRERRLLRRLINHDRLQRMIGDVDDSREIYSRLQDRLGWDYHYWLQRGSLEVECGDLGQAKTYLESARSLVDGVDYIVENEYAYLRLKRASAEPTALSATDDANAALADLEDAMRSRGRTDSYPYHVYGAQGLRWARRAPIGAAEKRALLGRLLEAVREGRKHHPKLDDLKQLERDLEREYLLSAT